MSDSPAPPKYDKKNIYQLHVIYDILILYTLKKLTRYVDNHI